MRFHFILVFVTSLMFQSHSAFAAWEDDFEKLKNVERSFEDAGAICEEIAAIDLREEFPEPQFEVIVGIAYGDLKRTIGELDVVVLDRSQNRVVQVAEVKCWKDFKAGLEKAKDQRSRFLRTLSSGHEIYFEILSPTKSQVDKKNFEGLKTFISVGPAGAKSAGYEQELEYTLRELHQMRTQMNRCQAWGECARP